MKRRPEIIILNIDAPELAKFLSMGLKGSKILEVGTTPKKNQIDYFVSEVKKRIFGWIVKVKVILYPRLLRLYRNTIMKHASLDQRFRRAWTARRAIRQTDAGQGNKFDLGLPHTLDFELHKYRKSLQSKVVFTFSKFSDYDLRLSDTRASISIWALDYDYLYQLKVPVENAQGQIVESISKIEQEYVPGYWAWHQQHRIKSAGTSKRILVFTNVAPDLSLDSLDQLSLAQAARFRGFKSILFISPSIVNSQRDFLSNQGFGFEFRESKFFIDVDSVNLLENLSSCSEILDLTGDKNLRLKFAAEFLGIAYRCVTPTVMNVQSDLIFMIARTFVHEIGIECENLYPQRVSEIECVKRWLDQINESLNK